MSADKFRITVFVVIIDSNYRTAGLVVVDYRSGVFVGDNSMITYIKQYGITVRKVKSTKRSHYIGVIKVIRPDLFH